MIAMNKFEVREKESGQPPGLPPIMIIAILFFVFGFVSWINAILIPYFKIACELNHFESYLVAFSFYIAYLVMSVPAGYLLKNTGFKKGMMAGFFIMALGALIFVPAGMTRTYGLFLTGLFTLGAGLAILQTAANPYVTILGPRERAAQRFSIMGICNKLAGILAPLLFAAVILKPGDSELLGQLDHLEGVARSAVLDDLAVRVVVPYAVVSLVLLLLGLWVRGSSLPEIDTEKETGETVAFNDGKKSVFDFPYLMLGAAAIFFHVGTQVIAIDTIINYASHHGISFIEAKVFPSYVLAATIIGYLTGIYITPRWISQLSVLKFCTVSGLLLSLLVIYAQGSISLMGHTTDRSVWALVLLGFANSMVWAGIWPLALDNLGRFIKVGASVLIMGLCGNAILPLVYGFMADRYDLRTAYAVLLPCYAYLIFYAFKGHRIRSWN